MKKLWLVLMIATMAMALGCGAGSAEKAAKKVLEGMKKGDHNVVLDHVDLEGVYETTVGEERREELPFEDFEESLREAAGEAKPKVPEGFDYKIIGSEAEDDIVIVKTKIKADKDAEWEGLEIPFKQFDGKWKITADAFQQLKEEWPAPPAPGAPEQQPPSDTPEG